MYKKLLRRANESLNTKKIQLKNWIKLDRTEPNQYSSYVSCTGSTDGVPSEATSASLVYYSHVRYVYAKNDDICMLFMTINMF